MILVGTKLDKEEERQVPSSEAKAIADHLNMLFIETSSEDGYDVSEVFDVLLREIVKQK